MKKTKMIFAAALSAQGAFAQAGGIDAMILAFLKVTHTENIIHNAKLLY